MTAHVVYGPPCSGKTTYVAERRGPNDIVIDQDALCVALGSPDDHDHPDRIKRIAGFARATAIRKSLELGLDVWIIDTFLASHIPREYPDCRYVLVDPGQSVTLQRARREGRPESSLAAIQRWYANPPTPPPNAPIEADTAAEANLGAVVDAWW